MKRVEIDFNAQPVLDVLAQLLDRVEDVDPALEEVGEYLIHSTKQRFVSKTAPDGTPWADNTALTQQLKGRNDPLIGEGHRLSNEIYRNVRGGVLEVGSPMEYAAMQHFGGTRAQFPNLWGDIEARPFLGVSSDDETAIVEILSEYLTGPT